MKFLATTAMEECDDLYLFFFIGGTWTFKNKHLSIFALAAETKHESIPSQFQIYPLFSSVFCSAFNDLLQ